MKRMCNNEEHAREREAHFMARDGDHVFLVCASCKADILATEPQMALAPISWFFKLASEIRPGDVIIEARPASSEGMHPDDDEDYLIVHEVEQDGDHVELIIGPDDEIKRVPPPSNFEPGRLIYVGSFGS